MQINEARGFNYSGSWGTSALDLWQHHDHGTMALEVARGKGYFPGWNLARWWLSHEAYQRNPERFLANFDAGLRVFADHGIQVIPLLFNRWRDPICDFGGVPLDHIIPGSSSYCLPGAWTSLDQPAWTQAGFADLDHDAENIFRAYLDDVVGAHRDDDRILGWDLCNEPLMGPYVEDPDSPIREGELQWLTWVRDVCRAVGASQPLTVGNYNSLTAIRLTEPLSDFISFHPYYIPNWGERTTSTKPRFEGFLDDVQAYAASVGKPHILASETVWGSNDDAEHVEFIRHTLTELGRRDIGFAIHALNHSLIADLHSTAYGPVGAARGGWSSSRPTARSARATRSSTSSRRPDRRRLPMKRVVVTGPDAIELQDVESAGARPGRAARRPAAGRPLRDRPGADRRLPDLSAHGAATAADRPRARVGRPRGPRRTRGGTRPGGGNEGGRATRDVPNRRSRGGGVQRRLRALRFLRHRCLPPVPGSAGDRDRRPGRSLAGADDLSEPLWPTWCRLAWIWPTRLWSSRLRSPSEPCSDWRRPRWRQCSWSAAAPKAFWPP